MVDQDSLVLLANVALHNQSVPSIMPRKRKESRPKELKIIHLNGTDIAEIDDLKNLPLSILFKIFVQKFEDVSRRCTVYVCKFGIRNGCNTKFMDVKENRIHRLEHLIQCHLIDHLMKIKSGSVIEIPKKVIENMKTRRLMNSMTEVDHSKKMLENHCSEVIQTGAKDEAERSFQGDKLPINERIESINDCAAKKTVEFSLINIDDHSYAMTTSESLTATTMLEEYPVVKTSNVDINELFPRIEERSEELTSFMMHEVLNRPVNIFIIDGKNLIVEELPIVGSEVEVSTDCDKSKIRNSVNLEDKVKFTCTLCPSSYFTKKSLNLHIRKKHSDLQEINPSKRKIAGNEGPRSTHETKAIKKVRPSTTSEDANNNWFVDLKENVKVSNDISVENDESILKTALTKNPAKKRPIINISNVWNNISVQYI